MDESVPSIGKNKHTSERLSFREYRPEDSQRFFEIMASSWPKLTESIHACSVDWYETSATWREVACVSETVVGILFGQTASDMNFPRSLRMTLAHWAVYLKLFLGRYGTLPHRLTAIREAIAVDRQIARSSACVDGEVTFFAVDAGYRSHGIGRSLMNRFVDNARSKGARRISVYAIDPGSNLPFYESYGFRRVTSFPDGFMSFATGEGVTAIIYILELPDNPTVTSVVSER